MPPVASDLSQSSGPPELRPMASLPCRTGGRNSQVRRNRDLEIRIHRGGRPSGHRTVQGFGRRSSLPFTSKTKNPRVRKMWPVDPRRSCLSSGRFAIWPSREWVTICRERVAILGRQQVQTLYPICTDDDTSDFRPSGLVLQQRDRIRDVYR